LEGVCGELRSFAARVVAHGRDADRRLRGRGFPESVPFRDTRNTLGKVNAAIQDLELSERALLIEPTSPVAPARKSAFKRAEEFFTEWRSTLAVVSLLVAALGLALRYLLG
jgi:hypothetical protein